EPRGADVRDGPGRLVLVRLRGQRERSVDLDVLQAADGALQLRAGADRLDVRQHAGDGLDALRVRPRLVHAGGVIVADQLLGAARRPVGAPGDVLEDVLQPLLVHLARLPAPAPARHRGGDGIRLAPGAVGELVEVGAGVGAAVDVGELHAVLLRGGRYGRTLLAGAG